MLKKTFTIVCTIVVGISLLGAQAPQPKLLRVSPFATVSQTIGVTTITITYHRPGVKGREIWGKLVPYNEVWRSGANNATIITFSDNVTISGTTLKAGSYSFFTIPTEHQWTVIFNSVADQWGAYSYDSTKTVLKFTVNPEQAIHEEWLSYSFSNLDVNSATITLRWEKIAVPFVVTTNTETNVMKSENDFAKAASQQAASLARYSLDKNENWEQGMAAVNRSIAFDKNFSNTTLKAQLYAQKEMWNDAVKTGDEALEAGKKANANTANFEKQLSEWKTKLPPTKGKKK